MNLRRFFAAAALALLVSPGALWAGDDKQIAHDASEITAPVFRFSGEFTIEQSYGGDAEVPRGRRHFANPDELSTNLHFD